MEKVYFFDLKEKDCLFIYEKFRSQIIIRCFSLDLSNPVKQRAQEFFINE